MVLGTGLVEVTPYLVVQSSAVSDDTEARVT